MAKAKSPKQAKSAGAKAASPKKAAVSKKLGLFKLLFKIFLVCAVIGLAYLVYLDAVVRHRFDGNRWSLPAKVYARPLELYAGKALTANDLSAELKLLGYEHGAADAPGQYVRSGNDVRVYARGFQFWDGPSSANAFRVRFDGDRVGRISGDEGEKLSIVRLDPVKIGGIYPAHHEDRVLINIKAVPSFVKDTLVTVEDRRFYQHHGVSMKAIARAFMANVKAGRTVQGGSTLTQQLVKNFFLTRERSITRKINEALMALLVELHYEKDEIMEAYLNEVYLGQAGRRAIHGFGLGAQYYFGRQLAEVKLHQAALLVGMVKGPSYYNPRRHPERALARRDLILDMLADLGVVKPEQAGWAKRQGLDLVPKPAVSGALYPSYMDLLRRQLRRDYRQGDLTTAGLNIFTTLDPLVQKAAEKSMESGVKELQRYYGGLKKLEGAMVVTSTDTGEVLALVGGRDTKYSGFNRALDAVRPIGSVIKPAIYLAALEDAKNYTLATPVDDGPLSVPMDSGKVWVPRNYDKKSHGMVPMHTALANSYNLAAARLGLEVGVPNVIETLGRLGVERELPPYPAILLGARGLTPLEVAGVYQTIAAGGFSSPLRTIREITDASGTPLERYELEIERRFDPGVMHLLYYLLQAAMREGTGSYVYRHLPLNFNVAGKTGTTDDRRDSWFAGFTGDRLAVVWLGNDDNSPARLTGSSGALKVWTQLIKDIRPAPLKTTVPENVGYYWIEESTGLLSAESCEGSRYLPFIKGSEPRRKAACIKKPVGKKLGDWIKSWF